MEKGTTKRRHTEKKERYKIYGEGINIERRQTQKRDYIGKRFHREVSIRRGNIYEEKIQKRRYYIWKESTWKGNNKEKRLHKEEH